MATARDFISPEEFTDAYLGLTKAQNARLRQAALQLAHFSDLGPDDLLQEAITRAIGGSRRCPRELNIVPFLVGAMRSIVSGETKKASRRPERDPNDEGDPDIFEDRNPQGLGRRSDDILIEVEQHRALLDLFVGDDVAQLIIEGMFDGMDGEELRTFVGLDPVTYNSKRRKIRRTINQTYQGKHGK